MPFGHRLLSLYFTLATIRERAALCSIPTWLAVCARIVHSADKICHTYSVPVVITIPPDAAVGQHKIAAGRPVPGKGIKCHGKLVISVTS